jgi:hypothetical protein
MPLESSPIGVMSWPGVNQVIEGSFTLCTGTSPSVCTLTIEPQLGTVAEHGTLQFSFGPTLIQLPGCKVDRAAFEYSEQGLLWQLSILDRRWRWQFGGISGVWNERHPDVGTAPAVGAHDVLPLPVPTGVIDQRSEATPQALAILCLVAMGEEVYDVSQLPNDSRPEVRWQHDNPAQELARLVEPLGCRVVLGLDNVVRICRVGQGAELPPDFIMRSSVIVDPPEKPDVLIVVGGRRRYQVDLVLEAAGQDVDGTVQIIDNLSYRPAEGWGKVQPSELGFLNVKGWDVDPLAPPAVFAARTLGFINPRQLARDTVFRWYRVSMQAIDDASKTPLIPGWKGNPGERIQALWQILPLLDTQVQGWFDEVRVFHPYPAVAYGVYFEGYWSTLLGRAPYQNSPLGSYCFIPFDIDRERGIIQFDDYCFHQNESGMVSPARLILRTTVHVRDYDTAAFDHYERVFETPGAPAGTPPGILQHEEIDYWVIGRLDPQTQKVTNLLTSEAVSAAEAGYYAQAEMLKYQTPLPQDVSYMGLLAISPDGAIQQVTWSVGPAGAITRASRNTEWNAYIPTFAERRQLEQLRVNNPTIRRLVDQSRKEGGR